VDGLCNEVSNPKSEQHARKGAQGYTQSAVSALANARGLDFFAQRESEPPTTWFEARYLPLMRGGHEPRSMLVPSTRNHLHPQRDPERDSAEAPVVDFVLHRNLLESNAMMPSRGFPETQDGSRILDIDGNPDQLHLTQNDDHPDGAVDRAKSPLWRRRSR
jgi:hypothetical protein